MDVTYTVSQFQKSLPTREPLIRGIAASKEADRSHCIACALSGQVSCSSVKKSLWKPDTGYVVSSHGCHNTVSRIQNNLSTSELLVQGIVASSSCPALSQAHKVPSHNHESFPSSVGSRGIRQGYRKRRTHSHVIISVVGDRRLSTL
jgi:hypothetical protein